MHDFLPFIITGLVTGSVYGLAGLGLVLTFRTSGIFNIGYGAVACGAAFVFYALNVQHGWPWGLAALVAVLVYGPIAGIGLEMVARTLDGASETVKVVSTVGPILVVAGIAALWFPENPPPFPHFLPQSTVKILGVYVTWEQIIVFLFAVAASAVLYWFFRAVRAGIVMRGIVDSYDLVALSGDNPVLVRRSAWIIGTVFASIAGLFLAAGLPLDGISLTTLVFGAFGAAAIGFFANMPMTFVGGILIGIGGALLDKYGGTAAWIGGLPPSLPFIVLFIVLILTPRRRLASLRMAPQVKVRRTYYAPLPVRFVSGLLAIGFLALIPAFSASKLALWSSGLVNVMLFLSLGLLVRNSGQISLCHITFAAVGAAAFGHFASTWGLPWLVALLLAALVAVPVGAIIALPAVRLSGIYLALATLGFGILMQGVFYSTKYMFGDTTLGLAEPRPAVKLGGWDMTTDKGFYYLLLLITVLVVVAVAIISSGRLGRLLRGMSDSQLALETRGTTSSVLKVIVFCLSAAIAAIAGALSGQLFFFSTSGTFPAFASVQLVVLVVIIQVGDPWYAVIGAILNTVLPGYVDLGGFTSYLNILFGVSALTVAIALGAAPSVPAPLQRLLDRAGRWRRTPADRARRGGGAKAPAVELSRAHNVSPDAGLEVRDVSVSYGGVKAVTSVSLRAPMGRVTGLIGPNGAGKTTFFNACSGIRRPDSGQVLFNGEDVTRRGPAYRARKGMGRTFQRPELFHSLTVRENVALGCEASMAGANPLTQAFDSPAAARRVAAVTDEVLALTDLEDIADRQVGLLSIGQRRVVELAVVLAGPFDILLLDEPSSGLDGAETEKFGTVLRMVVESRGVGILLVEHDMTLVRSSCDRLYVLDFGTTIFEGSPAEMEDSDAVRAAYLGETTTRGSGHGGTDVLVTSPAPEEQ
jgi:ABC-type branched-subunit amino acid transport system ATPase component/branched-subunit amino acid ABC-type transport system permease component